MTEADILAAYAALAEQLRRKAMDIEGRWALWAGVQYGHAEAQNDETRAWRRSAAAIEDLIEAIRRGDEPLPRFDGMNRATPGPSNMSDIKQAA